MKQGISPATLIRLLQVMNPIMIALTETPKPLGIRTTIIEDMFEGKKRFVVVLKCAYSSKQDAEKLVQLDAMIDKI